MKRIFLAIALIMVSGYIFAQSATIYLKSGRRFSKVNIIDLNEKTIEFSSLNGDTTSYYLNSIRSLSFKKIKNEDESTLTQPGIKSFGDSVNNKWEVRMAFGWLMRGDGGSGYAEVLAGAGYKLTPYVTTGLTVGVMPMEGFSMVPIYADFSGTFYSSFIRPAYSLKVGYAFAPYNHDAEIETTYKGGLSWHPEVGMAMRIHETDLTFMVGYAHFTYTRTQPLGWWGWGQQGTLAQEIGINRLSLSLSGTF